jgi:hypothetical protein
MIGLNFGSRGEVGGVFRILGGWLTAVELSNTVGGKQGLEAQ